MHIVRELFPLINKRLSPGKAVLILGPRQVGKSTLMQEIAKHTDWKIKHFDCDDAVVRARLAIQTLPNLQNMVGDADLILIDEAQRVKNIGLTLKIIIDQIKDIRLLVSGSSALELANEINEPLTGRKWEYHLLPIATQEMVDFHGAFEESRYLEQRLLYGMYPEVITNPGDELAILNQLASSYLYKDIFTFQDLRKPELLDKLLKALALQVGSETSYNKLAQFIGSDISTVQRYIDLLEKSFIIFRLRAFSRNLRNELKRSRKIYFIDCGIRNAIIGDFRPLAQRNDIGGLWENFLVSERLKRNQYNNFYGQSYFWRTTAQQEVDYLEDYDGQLHAYEFKWSAKKHATLPITFRKAYPNSSFTAVSPENYQDFLSK
jgi:uncharacterized protein